MKFEGGNPTGSHRLEGMGPGFITSITRVDLIDEIVGVSDDDAYATARRLAREEGIFGGASPLQLFTSQRRHWGDARRAARGQESRE